MSNRSKNWVLVVLAVALGFSMFYRGDDIDNYESQISELKKQNIELSNKNDSLELQNDSLTEYIDKIDTQLVEIQKDLDDSQDKIDKLQGKRNEIPTVVNVMDGNDVANSFSEYLERRGKNND